MSWSPEKLEALRATFEAKTGGDMVDPKHQEIADHIFSQGGNRPAPYAGIPTLLDAPARSGDDALSGLQVALYGMPMDLAVTNRNGSRFGPRALRAIERVGPYNDAHHTAPLHQMTVADIGDVPFRSRFDLAKCHADIEGFVERICNAGVIPVGVGGDHSVSHPVLRVIGRDRPVGMIHIDAHCDTGGAYEGEKFHHGGPFRNAVLDGVLDPERTIQIGIRGAAGYIWEFSQISGMTVIEAKDINGLGLDAIIAKARQVVGDGPTYFSFDIDSLDPAFAPGTGTPSHGGFTYYEGLELLDGLTKRGSVAGVDLVEVAPDYDHAGCTSTLAAQLLLNFIGRILHHRA